VVLVSACSNGSKIRESMAGSIPTPVSATVSLRARLVAGEAHLDPPTGGGELDRVRADWTWPAAAAGHHAENLARRLVEVDGEVHLSPFQLGGETLHRLAGDQHEVDGRALDLHLADGNPRDVEEVHR
jgi:hypothetical protein